jgi:asparagine synthase (glutamine-hydrolysing)
MPHGALGKNFLYNISLDPLDRYIDSVSAFNGPGKRALYSTSYSDSLNGQASASERLFRQIAKAAPVNEIDRLLYLDSKTYLPGDILTKVDRMTMANSLEARVPLLDHELIELAARIPADLKMRDLETKYILKRAMGGVVPDEILYRKKQGFGVPISKWINDQLRDRISDDLSSRRAVGRGYFDPGYIRTLLKEHSIGRRDHSHALWSLWMLEHWFRAYVDASPNS